jgi:diguanylate cyclase (GGDEF)-like protein/PAS domain S-box-containing protein
VVLPAFKQWVPDGGTGKQIHYNRPLPAFREHSWPALINVFVDSDGLVRRYPYGDQVQGSFLPSLAALLGDQLRLPQGSFLIDYSIQSSTVPVISYADVLHWDKATLERLLANKKVIVGATALELGDRVNIPGGRILAGAMLQALATESLLQGRALQVVSVVPAFGAALVLVTLTMLTWHRLSHRRRAGALICVAAVAEITAIAVQYRWPYILDTSILHVAALGYLAVGTSEEVDLRGLLSRLAERRFQRVAMSVGDGLVCVDRGGLITFWNPGAVAMFGYEPGEAIGIPLQCLVAQNGGAEEARAVSFTPDILERRGGEVIELEGRRKNGQLFPVEARLFAWETTNGIEYGALLRDISVRKRETERIKYLAQVDTLTGLANRHTLREHLDATLMEAEVEKSECAVLVLDLDKFKDINDSLGHTCGDELLSQIAARLRDLVGDAGLVARLGGDEFAIVLSGLHVVAASEQFAEQICRVLKKENFSVHGRRLQIGCSIGIAIYPRDTISPDQLLSSADLALYQAKAQGGGKWTFFSQEIKDALAAKLSLQRQLERAIKHGEFELFYQPQARLADKRLTGVEALIRWRHPERGLLSPADFMPAVHASAFSNDVAWWVLETACRKARDWERQGRNVRVSVNLSPSQLQSDELIATVAKVLRTTGLSPGLLELEVTEDTLLNDDARAAEIFARLRGLGVRLSFDDFGTGYGSLSYLKKFPFDTLKIDRSFVRDLRAGTDDAAIVSTTIALSKLLGLSVIAEGIEDAATVDLLVGMGCDEGQGYYFGRPVPAAEFEQKWFAARPSIVKAADAA